MPRPDFPKSVMEFQRRFATDEACLEYLIELRWPGALRRGERSEGVEAPGGVTAMGGGSRTQPDKHFGGQASSVGSI